MDITSFAGFQNLMRSKGFSDVYALVLYSQAKHETNNFLSNVYQNANNAFGMKVARQRAQERIGEYNGYAMYADDNISVIDRINLDIYNGIPEVTNINDIQAYMSAVLSAGYAEDPDYFEKWFDHVRRDLKANRSLIDNVPNDELDWLLAQESPTNSFKMNKKLLTTIVIFIAGLSLLAPSIWKRIKRKIPFIN